MLPTKQVPQKLLEPISSTYLKTEVDMSKVACTHCGKDFGMRQLYNHINDEHSINKKVSPPNLNTTSLSSSRIKELPSPMVRSNDSSTFNCENCAMVFETVQSFTEHVETMHWNLDISKTGQVKPTDLSKKRRKSDGSVEIKKEKRKADEVSRSKVYDSPSNSYDTQANSCICAICLSRVVTFLSFFDHMDIHIKEMARLICPFCGEYGRDITEYSNHVTCHVVKYTSEACCQKCRMTFVNAEELYRHLIDVHSQNMYKCTLCNDLFDSPLAIQVKEIFKK